MELNQVILAPIVTEKSTTLQAGNNQYTFRVHRDANKIEVRMAVEVQFGVRVDKVRTQVVRGDWKRVGAHIGRKRFWKKAIVSVREGDTIDLYSEGGEG